MCVRVQVCKCTCGVRLGHAQEAHSLALALQLLAAAGKSPVLMSHRVQRGLQGAWPWCVCARMSGHVAKCCMLPALLGAGGDGTGAGRHPAHACTRGYDPTTMYGVPRAVVAGACAAHAAACMRIRHSHPLARQGLPSHPGWCWRKLAGTRAGR